MILYANGCSHTAAAEAVVPEGFAVDDGKHGIDRRPHPLNLAASWCTRLAEQLGAELVCHAESASSNDRILRTTQQWLDNQTDLSDVFVVIQWTTWEREEWLHEGTWYQVNASGADWVPQELSQRYKQFVVDVDWTAKTQEWYKKIWDLHVELSDKKVTHLFYNGWSTFSDITDKKDFGTSYMYPYNQQGSYNAILQQKGHVPTKWYHFDAAGHCFWANYVLQYIKQHNLVTTHALSTD